jgi:1-acyl-sn-glycerol-3-phosphate acyltransferase
MVIVRVFLKGLFFGSVLFLYFLASLLITLLSGGSFEKARPHLAKLVTLVSSTGLKIFGIKVVQNFKKTQFEENYLIVSNHLSYTDILVISSFFPCCFVTSKEMKNTPFLGQLCLLGGCLFVDRKNRKHIHSEVKELTNALELGLNVVIFPEATSTNGSSVIAFKRPLFQAAIDSNSLVLPVCLNYRTIDSKPVTLENRDTVCWYGDMTFLNHVVKIFSHKKIVVELNILSPLKARDYADKNELALKCFEVVSKEYSAIV